MKKSRAPLSLIANDERRKDVDGKKGNLTAATSVS